MESEINVESASSRSDDSVNATPDIRKADASYRPFPSFDTWSRAELDTGRWDRYSSLLASRREVSPDILRKSREVVKRAAAMDTGAIEGLYEVDRGFTFSVATEAALWEAALDRKGPEVRAFFESQLQAYDYVLDLATQEDTIGEAWIRTLHKQICHAQKTYAAQTEIGVQELVLPLGEYKHLPNHVRGRDEQIHSYAPVDLTPSEMHRLCEEIRSASFSLAHPILQASYAHYSFVCIHPFADGNGRVARALASVFMYRSQSVPLLILAENRGEYITALESADTGDFRPFIDFVMERALDAIRLVDESIRTAMAPSVNDSLATIKRLYVTKGGYSHTEVDQAGIRLLELLKTEFSRQLGEMSLKGTVNCNVNEASASAKVYKPSDRLLLSGPRGLRFSASTDIPANASVHRNFAIEVPKDCGRDDDLAIVQVESGSLFEARMTELHPVVTAALQMRISILVQGMVSEVLGELAAKATSALKTR